MSQDYENNEQRLCSKICTLSLVSLPAETAFCRKFIDQFQLLIFLQNSFTIISRLFTLGNKINKLCA